MSVREAQRQLRQAAAAVLAITDRDQRCAAVRATPEFWVAMTELMIKVNQLNKEVDELLKDPTWNEGTRP